MGSQPPAPACRLLHSAAAGLGAGRGGSGVLAGPCSAFHSGSLPPAAGDGSAFPSPSSRSRLEVHLALLGSFPRGRVFLGLCTLVSPSAPGPACHVCPRLWRLGCGSPSRAGSQHLRVVAVPGLRVVPGPMSRGSPSPPSSRARSQPSCGHCVWAWREDPLSPLWAQGRATAGLGQVPSCCGRHF